MSEHTITSEKTETFGKCSRSGPTLYFAATKDNAAAAFGPSGGNRDVNRLYARRLVACWNACLGATTEWLETQEQVVLLGPPIADHFRGLEQQRDELLETLRVALAAMHEAEILIGDHSPVPGDLLDAISDAHEAISKHQGR